jgi:hypothetical protein
VRGLLRGRVRAGVRLRSLDLGGKENVLLSLGLLSYSSVLLLEWQKSYSRVNNVKYILYIV